MVEDSYELVSGPIKRYLSGARQRGQTLTPMGAASGGRVLELRAQNSLWVKIVKPFLNTRISRAHLFKQESLRSVPGDGICVTCLRMFRGGRVFCWGGIKQQDLLYGELPKIWFPSEAQPIIG